MWLFYSLILSLVTRGVLVDATRVQVDGYRSFCGCIILTSLNDTTNAAAAQQLRQDIYDVIGKSDRDKCDSWTDYPDYKITTFANRYGEPTSNVSESAGVFAPDLYAFCGPPKVEQKFSFQDFSASTAGLLLPWIVLFAQLPRQTGSLYGDLLSTFVSIGSPIWILSSIMLAIFFRLGVRRRFERLQAKVASGHSGIILLHFSKICEAAKIILQAFDQAPVRLNPQPGFLSSLIASLDNHWWWISSAVKFEALWRRVDAVFVVQTVVAALAWFLAIIANFWTLPGSASSNNSLWQICMGTLWLWVFAATYGPIANKSLYEPHATRYALSSPRAKQDSLYFSINDEEVPKQRVQTAIVQRPGLNPIDLPRRRQSAWESKKEAEKAHDIVRIPKIWGLSIEGDADTEGLSTFPWRFFASWQSVDYIAGGFEAFYQRLENNQVPNTYQDGTSFSETERCFDNTYKPQADLIGQIEGVLVTEMTDVRPIKVWDWTKPPGENLRGTPKSLDQYLKINPVWFTAYPEWKEINLGQWARYIMANIFGLVVQWSTSAPAIFVMYYSPPVGLGCDSGALLIYAVFATFSWLMLNLGNLFSHTALLRYQRWHHKHPDRTISDHYRRNKSHTFYCRAAVATRILGKSIAVINACWIIVWSFLTYTNVFETPYCTTAYYSRGEDGWMRLWDFDPPQFTAIKVQELQYLVFGSFIAYFACVLIFILTSTRRHRWMITAFLSLGFTVFVIPLYFYGVEKIQSVS